MQLHGCLLGYTSRDCQLITSTAHRCYREVVCGCVGDEGIFVVCQPEHFSAP